MSAVSIKELSEILSYSQFVVLSGAGISVSAGLNPFRVQKRTLNKDKLTSLEFSQSGDPMKLFNFAAEMCETVKKAKPTKFHLLLKYFLLHKKLIRHYTMNVDCLENQVFTRIDGSYISLQKSTIRLHGEILSSVCFRCGSSYKVTNDILETWKGNDPSNLFNCSNTECMRPSRSLKTLRVKTIIQRKSDQSIQAALKEDWMKKPDLLLIAGASLSIDVQGQFMIIDHFKRCNPQLRIIVINIEQPKNAQYVYILGN
ncbi:hypothetical protein HDV02_005011 [Globomyces sp. JEL0801]|nr:hypothetical protein HDV02_005011 [Globomyces sp. JEL0801]